MTYSLLSEAERTAYCFFLFLAPVLLLGGLMGKQRRDIVPVLVLYLLLFCWARGARIEATTAKQLVGYHEVTEVDLDPAGQGVFNGGNGVGIIRRREPVYAQENKWQAILWGGPLLAFVGLLPFDIGQGTKRSCYLLGFLLPFLLLAYSLLW